MIPLDLPGIEPDLLRDLVDVARGFAPEVARAPFPAAGSDRVVTLDVWVTTIDSRGLVVVSGQRHLPSGRATPFLDPAVSVDAGERVARTSLWWVRLGDHLTEPDPDRVRSKLIAAAARCDELRAALLARDGEGSRR